MKSTTDATLPIIFTDDGQEYLFSDGSMTIRDQTMEESVQNVIFESASTESSAMPQGTTNEMHVPPPGCSLPLNMFDDFMTDDMFLPIQGDNTWNDQLFQLDDDDHLMPFNDDTLPQEHSQVMSDNIAAPHSEPVSTISPIIPSSTIDEMHVPTTNSSMQLNQHDHIMPEPNNHDDFFQSMLREDDNWRDLFQLLEDQLFPLDDTQGQEQTQVQRENVAAAVQSVTNVTTSPIELNPTNSTQNLNISITPGLLSQPIPLDNAQGQEQTQVQRDNIAAIQSVTNVTTSPIGLIPTNSSQNLNIFITPGLLPQPCILNAGEHSSQRPVAQALGGNMGVVNQIRSSENCSNISYVGEGSSPIGLIPTNSSQNVNISITPGLLPQPCIFNAGEGSSQRPVAQALGGNRGVVNQIPSPENCSNVSNAGKCYSLIGLIPNSSQNMNISITPGLLPQPCIFNAGAGSSQRSVAQALGGNMGIVNPIPSSENCSNISNLLLTQNNSNLWPAIPKSWFQTSGMNSSTNGSGTTGPHDPPPVCFSFGNSMFFTAGRNGSVTPFQPSPSLNFPVLPYASSSNSHHQQFQNFGAPTMAANTTWVSPMLMTSLDYTLQQNQTLSLKTQLERGLAQLPRDIASQSLVTNGYSKGVGQELRGNVGGVMNPILRPQSYPNSPLSLPQNNANPWLHPATGSSSSSSSQQPQFAKNNWLEMSASTPLSTLANAIMRPNAWIPRQYNIQRPFRPQPPTFKDFPQFVQAWKGSLVAKIHWNRTSLNQAKAYRRPSSPDTLTANWSGSLKIALFLPKKAVNHTARICNGPIDYMFFHITRYNNLHFYDYLMSKNLCAKIDFSSQTVILSTSESKFHFIGTIFPRETVFVEPVYLDIESPDSKK